jgi:hypothetical protein
MSPEFMVTDCLAKAVPGAPASLPVVCEGFKALTIRTSTTGRMPGERLSSPPLALTGIKQRWALETRCSIAV